MRAATPRRDAADEASLWEGLKVELEFDEERTDSYGRLLAYVHDPLTDEMMNAEMLRSGYAQLWIIPPNTKHEDELRAAQREAKKGSLGLGLDIWSLPPDKETQLADHGNGIGSCDGACPSGPQENTASASASGSASPDPNRSNNVPNNSDRNRNRADDSSSSSTAAPGGSGRGRCEPGAHWVGPNGPGDGDGDGCAGEE